MTSRDDDAGDRGPGEAAADQEASQRARLEAEERAWRDIVDHYGEAPDVDGLSDLTTPVETPARTVEFLVVRPAFEPDGDEHFTPPPLPPPAVISPERRAAWVGLIASPLLLIVFQLFDLGLPGIIDVGLVIACVASFGYLVATMTPRDPDDDGARL